MGGAKSSMHRDVSWSTWDATCLASASLDGHVYIWKLDDPKSPPLKLQGHVSVVTALSWCHGEHGHLASAGEDGRVLVWDTAAAKPEKLRLTHIGVVSAVAWSFHDSALIASGGDDKYVHVWDLSSPNMSRKLRGHDGAVLCAAWSPLITSQLASGSREGKICIWDVSDLTSNADKPARVLTGHLGEVRAVSWSLFDSDRLASGGQDSTVLVWDIKDAYSTPKKLLGHAGGVCAVAWSPHPKSMLVSGGEDMSVFVWDPASNYSHRKLHLPEDIGQICALDWSPYDSALLAIAGDHLCIWNADSDQLSATLVHSEMTESKIEPLMSDTVRNEDLQLKGALRSDSLETEDLQVEGLDTFMEEQNELPESQQHLVVQPEPEMCLEIAPLITSREVVANTLVPEEHIAYQTGVDPASSISPVMAVGEWTDWMKVESGVAAEPAIVGSLERQDSLCGEPNIPTAGLSDEWSGWAKWDEASMQENGTTMLSQDSPKEELCNSSGLSPFAQVDAAILERKSFGLADGTLEEIAEALTSPPLEYQTPVEAVSGRNHDTAIFQVSHDIFSSTAGVVAADSEGHLHTDHSPIQNDILLSSGGGTDSQEGQRKESDELHSTINNRELQQSDSDELHLTKDTTLGTIYADRAGLDGQSGVMDTCVERQGAYQKSDALTDSRAGGIHNQDVSMTINWRATELEDSTSEDMTLFAPDAKEEEILQMKQELMLASSAPFRQGLAPAAKALVEGGREDSLLGSTSSLLAEPGPPKGADVLDLDANVGLRQTQAELEETEAQSEDKQLEDDVIVSPLSSTVLNPTHAAVDGGVWSVQQLKGSLLELEAALETARQESAQKDEQLQTFLASMSEKNRELSIAERDLLEKERAIVDVRMQMNDQEHCYQDLQHALIEKSDGYSMKVEELNTSKRQLEELHQRLLHREEALRSNEQLIVEKEQALERLRHMEAERLAAGSEPSVVQVWAQWLFYGCTQMP